MLRAKLGLSLPIALSLSLGMFGVGCSSSSNPPDASNVVPDSTPMTPDASPPDSGAPDANLIDGGPGLTTNEGGIVYAEYFKLSNLVATAFGGDSTHTYATRLIGDFLDNMTPQYLGFGSFTSCTKANNMWDSDGNGTPLWPTQNGTNKTFLDVGANVTAVGMNEAGNAKTFTAPNKGMGTDSFGRADDVYYQLFSLVDNNAPLADSDTANRYMPGSWYDFSWAGNTGGSPAIAATTYTKALYIPTKFDLTVPTLNNEVTDPNDNTKKVNFVLHETAAGAAGDNMNMTTWTNGTNTPKAILTATILASVPSGIPVLACAGPPGTASTTIGPDAVKSFHDTVMSNPEFMGEDPNHALLLHQNFLHNPLYLRNGETNNPRRIDFVGVYCYTQLAAITN